MKRLIFVVIALSVGATASPQQAPTVPPPPPAQQTPTVSPPPPVQQTPTVSPPPPGQQAPTTPAVPPAPASTSPLPPALALQAPAPSDGWSGRIGFGYASITGNSRSSNVTADVDVHFDAAPWHHESTAQAYRSTATDQTTELTSTTAERYSLGYKLKFDFSEFNYVFGLAGFDRDLFSGYRRQFSEVVGYGRRVINTQRQTLNLEVGVGARQSDLSDDTTQDEGLGRLAGEYLVHIGESSQFSQKVSTEIGADNTFSEAISALTTTVVHHIGLSISYTVRYNSSVPAGTQGTDAYTAVTLQYAF